ncbi:MAG: GNAT family N-acetyltransferase [Lactobacillaceae bacterium]|jgi:ribosomal-protein-serine acetyltransferase|nr:GNAT family N-acetyltransferase [Lactobacillaceae bacterium]
MNIGIEALSIEHAAEIFTLLEKSRNEVGQFLDWESSIKTIDDEKTAIKFFVEQGKIGILKTFAIKKDNKIIGMIDLDRIQNGTAEVGYWIGTEFVGNGFVSAALKILEKYAKNELKLTKLFIKANSLNHRSVQVAIRNNYSVIKNKISEENKNSKELGFLAQKDI